MKVRVGSKFLRLHLIAGSLVFASMILLLAAIAEDVVRDEPLTVVDAQFSNWLHLNGSPGLTRLMLVITSFGATWTVVLVTVAFLIYLRSRRSLYWMVTVVSAVLGGMLLNRFLKLIFHRPRPYFEDPILTLTSFSFPSGHTIIATVLYGVMAAYFIAQTRSSRRRVLITLAAGLMIALVGFSRIYLGAHYLTDVLAAMAEGLAWLSLCLTLAYSIWLSRSRHGTPTDGDKKAG